MRVGSHPNLTIALIQRDTFGPARFDLQADHAQPAHHLHHAARDRFVPAQAAHDSACPPTPPSEPRPQADAASWLSHLCQPAFSPACCQPEGLDCPPPPDRPKPWFIPYPSHAEARTGNLLDLLA